MFAGVGPVGIGPERIAIQPAHYHGDPARGAVFLIPHAEGDLAPGILSAGREGDEKQQVK